MITDLKIYAIIVLALWQGVAQWQLHSVKTDYREYKESINDQVQQAKNEKIRIEAEQRAKLDKAKLDYSDSRQRLGDALKRLRDAEVVSGHSTMPMAGNSASAVPGTSENTAGTIVKLATFRGTCDIDFYEKAMIQTLQCSRLIEFVKP